MHKNLGRVLVLVMTLTSLFLIFFVTPKKPCYPSADITTSPNYQAIAKSNIENAVKKTSSIGGSILIKDITNNNILAKTSVLNNQPKDSCGQDIDLTLISWEPGSTIKPITAQIVMDITDIDPDTYFHVEPIKKYNDKTILNYRMFPPGEYKVEDIVSQSINTGVATIYESLDSQPSIRRKEWFSRLVNTYGLNKSTGYKIKNEDVGYIPNYKYTKNADYRYSLSSFGIGIHTTPLQLVNAYGVALTNHNNTLKPSSVTKLKKILQYDIASKNLNNKNEIDKSIYIGGKTGTSSMINQYLDYSDREIGSFIGFIESKNAKYIMLVQLIAPHSEHPSTEAMDTWLSLVKQLNDRGLIQTPK